MKAYPNNQNCSYPRLCAHRGFSMASPENTLPAFALALAMGAQEIEVDLWLSKDGHLIVCHDPSVDRTSNGTGLIKDLTLKDIKELDAGCWFSSSFKGITYPLFEEVLDLVAGKTIINIHIKSPAISYPKPDKMKNRSIQLRKHHMNHQVIMPPVEEGQEDILPAVENRPWVPYSQTNFQKILDTLDAYNNRQYVYITGEADVLSTAREMAPDLARCCLEGHMNYTIVDHAVEYGCQKLQFCKGLTTMAMINKAKKHGLICNLFWTDDADEAKAYLDLGIDCLLTNNYQPIRTGLVYLGYPVK